MKYLIKETFLVALNKFHFPVVLSTSILWLFLIDLALVFSRKSGKTRFYPVHRARTAKASQQDVALAQARGILSIE